MKCVLFDFDGVLADTERYNSEYLAKALRNFGIILTEEERKAIVGVNDPAFLSAILARSPGKVTLEDLEEERQKVGSIYEGDPRLKAEPGAIHALQEIKGMGLRLAIVSSTRHRKIQAALRHLGLDMYFEFALCGDQVTKRKPAPDPYRMALEMLGTSAEEAVAVEDSPTGIMAGKSAGLRTIAYKGGSITQDTSQADYEITSLSQLPALLGEL